MSKPRIAIPMPTSFDPAYNRQNWPAYAEAVTRSGGEPVAFGLELAPAETARLAGTCHGVLLPGSPADVNPEKYGQVADPASAAPDPARENVDELLIQDAHNLYKPILGICFGTQMLNVWRTGTLLQDLTVLPVNHSAARGVIVAHTVSVAAGSLLERIVGSEEISGDTPPRLPVNSSHHQAVGIAGDGLIVSARCPQDGVAESIELRSDGASPEHFLLGVQWHPERTYEQSAASRAIFRALVDAAGAWRPRAVHTSVVAG